MRLSDGGEAKFYCDECGEEINFYFSDICYFKCKGCGNSTPLFADATDALKYYKEKWGLTYELIKQEDCSKDEIMDDNIATNEQSMLDDLFAAMDENNLDTYFKVIRYVKNEAPELKKVVYSIKYAKSIRAHAKVVKYSVPII